jgi:hypothetical protein
MSRRMRLPGICPGRTMARKDWLPNVLPILPALLLAGGLQELPIGCKATQVNLAAALKESPRSTTPRSVSGRTPLNIQVAFSMVLLIGAGLFVGTLQKLANQDFGFNPHNLVLLPLNAGQSGESAQRASIHWQLCDTSELWPVPHSSTLFSWIMLCFFRPLEAIPIIRRARA